MATYVIYTIVICWHVTGRERTIGRTQSFIDCVHVYIFTIAKLFTIVALLWVYASLV